MIVRANGDRAMLWCPGCDDLHAVGYGAADKWQFDGNLERPTISPSILVHGNQWPPEYPEYVKHRHASVKPGDDTICHSFVRDGQWQFLPDSTHVLSGQTVPCVPIPDGLINDA